MFQCTVASICTQCSGDEFQPANTSVSPRRQGRFSWRNVHSGEERGQTAVVGADYLTCEGVWVTWFGYKLFFPNLSGDRFFCDMQSCNLFFFSVGYFLPRCFLAIIFSPPKSVCRIFLRKSPIPTPSPPPPHLKSQMVGPTASQVNL